MESITEVGKKKDRIRELVLQIISENDGAALAASHITAVIMAKRCHVEGMDGAVAMQQKWTENQCRLLIEMLA